VRIRFENIRYINYARNLVGISFGRCLRNRLLSGSSMWFTIGSYDCALRLALHLSRLTCYLISWTGSGAPQLSTLTETCLTLPCSSLSSFQNSVKSARNKTLPLSALLWQLSCARPNKSEERGTVFTMNIHCYFTAGSITFSFCVLQSK
jgi:hypothetical protein